MEFQSLGANTVLYATEGPQATLGKQVCWLFKWERRNGTYFQMKETYLAKSCSSTNLAPQALRLVSSIVFGP